MGDWFIGAFINIIGSIAINFGTNLLKLGQDQSLLAALGSIQFVSNIGFAFFVLNKTVSVKSNMLRLTLSGNHQFHSWFTCCVLLLFFTIVGFWARASIAWNFFSICTGFVMPMLASRTTGFRPTLFDRAKFIPLRNSGKNYSGTEDDTDYNI